MNKNQAMNGINEAGIGHNSSEIRVKFEVRLFNSITRYVDKQGGHHHLSLPAGSTIADVLKYFSLPPDKVFLIYVNGRDISPRLGAVRIRYVIEEGDVVALSGPVPYSYGYGAPIV